VRPAALEPIKKTDPLSIDQNRLESDTLGMSTSKYSSRPLDLSKNFLVRFPRRCQARSAADREIPSQEAGTVSAD
jgi:hypothetical protein